MSREEAAAKAMFARRWGSTDFDEATIGEHAEHRRDATSALTAADSHDAAHNIHRLVLDSAAVERAARALEPALWRDGNGWSDWSRERSKDKARAVLAAAVEADQ